MKTVLRKIEELNETLFVYATFDKLRGYYIISVSQYDFYISDEFKRLRDKYRIVANKVGIKIIFVCGWKPNETFLLNLAEDNNLLIT